MTHNELLKLARKQAGMSQTEFAGYFQMSVKTLRHWEINERKVPDYLLRLMLYKLEMEGYQKIFLQKGKRQVLGWILYPSFF